MKQSLLGAFVLCQISVCLAQESYFCAVEHSGGVKYNKQEKVWEAVVFNDDRKVLVTKAIPGHYDLFDGSAWVVKRLGDQVATGFCRLDFNEHDILHCVMPAGEFKFNRKNMRFLLSYTVGYWNDTISETGKGKGTEGDDSPYISVGRCSAIK